MKEQQNLLHRIAADDLQAFQELYQLYHVKVFNTSLSYLQNHHDAEELTQDIFVAIHRSASKFQGKSSVSTWIYQITINKCLDFIRYRQRKKRFATISLFFDFDKDDTQKELPDFEHPGIIAENKENAKVLFKAIKTLSINQKTAFILSFVEELPRQEVANIMEVSLKSVESLLQRAKANLRDELEAYYPHRRKNKK